MLIIRLKECLHNVHITKPCNSPSDPGNSLMYYKTPQWRMAALRTACHSGEHGHLQLVRGQSGNFSYLPVDGDVAPSRQLEPRRAVSLPSHELTYGHKYHIWTT